MISDTTSMYRTTFFRKETVKLNCIDCLLLCYVTIVIISLCIHPEGFSRFVLSKCAIYSLCYIVARRLREKQYILWGIILIGVFESIFTVCQQLHWVESLHRAFDITGTFGNPGPLGMFMSLAITVALGMFQKRVFRDKLLKLGLLFLISLFAYVLVLSDSRAGWVAAMIGCGFIWYKHRGELKLRLWMRCVLLVVGIFLAIGGYYYKQDSANGRLLIWRVAANMIADAPITGHGIESFPKEYMYYQARYFQENPDSKYKILADNIIYPYNEFILIAVELGIVGLLVALAVCLVVFLSALQKDNIILGGTFMAFITFSIFSYPSQTFLLWILFPFLLGGIKERKEIVCRLPFKKYIIYGACIICLYFYFHGCYRYYRLSFYMEELYRNLQPEYDSDANRYLCLHKKDLASIPHLLDLYAQYSCHRFSASKNVDIQRYTASIIPTSEIWCDIGDLYVSCHQTKEAIESYKMSAEMIPSRITPKYKLAMLYYEMGDMLRFRLVGEDILNMEIKIKSTGVLKMVTEIKQRLQKCSNKKVGSSLK